MEYTNNWFDENISVWDAIIPNLNPKKILEIGSYEGRSLCYLIEKLGNIHPLEIHAIDSWEGGQDYVSRQLHETIKMKDIEGRFSNNLKEVISKNSKHQHDIKIHKGSSDLELSKLYASEKYKDYFDFIYVDGSHSTADTISDLVLSFKMLKPKGIMIVDDYLWSDGYDPDYVPKLAIDAFVNLHLKKIQLVAAPIKQVYILKK